MSAVLELLGLSACAEARRAMRAGEQLRAQLMWLAGGSGTVRVHSESAWASVTFKGARHTLQIRFEGAWDVGMGEAMIALLPDHDFSIPGQLVVDIAVIDVDQRMMPQPVMTVTVEALLLEED